MKHRVFIAINLPEKVKKRLKEYQEKFSHLPVRWIKSPSLHLTLIFIGYVSNEQMLEACRAAREVASGTEPFFIDFKRIVLGPFAFTKASTDAKALADKSAGKPDKPPRMIWLIGETNEPLSRLKNELEKALLAVDSGLSHIEQRSFKPHITLARLKPEEWARMENPPEIDEEFLARARVESVEVMESDLKRDGAEYAVLESCPFRFRFR